MIDFNEPVVRIRALFKALVAPYPLPRIRVNEKLYEVTKHDLVDQEYYMHVGRVVNICERASQRNDFMISNAQFTTKTRLLEKSQQRFQFLHERHNLLLEHLSSVIIELDLQGNINFAYHVELSNDWFFRPAIEVGFGAKSFNFDNLVLADQININSGTINSTSSDPLAMNANRKINFVDFTAGFVFDRKNPRNDSDLWLGAAVRHLNKPNISFVENGNVPLDIFYSLHASYKFPYLNRNDMQLSANYMQQGEYNRLDLGAMVKIDKLMLGAMAVTNPAKNNSNSHLLTSINAFVGLEFEQLRFGFSYDVNTTNIGRTDGVYELSLTYLSRCLICRNPANTERRK